MGRKPGVVMKHVVKYLIDDLQKQRIDAVRKHEKLTDFCRRIVDDYCVAEIMGEKNNDKTNT